jgi:hypothetical protein
VGQTIEILSTKAIDRMLIVDTDRSITGQDGEAFNGIEAARRGVTFAAKLAVRIFEADDSVDHVYSMSNTVAVRRLSGWDTDSMERAAGIVADFFRFYR